MVVGLRSFFVFDVFLDFLFLSVGGRRRELRFSFRFVGVGKIEYSGRL